MPPPKREKKTRKKFNYQPFGADDSRAMLFVQCNGSGNGHCDTNPYVTHALSEARAPRWDTEICAEGKWLNVCANATAKFWTKPVYRLRLLFPMCYTTSPSVHHNVSDSALPRTASHTAVLQQSWCPSDATGPRFWGPSQRKVAKWRLSVSPRLFVCPSVRVLKHKNCSIDFHEIWLKSVNNSGPDTLHEDLQGGLGPHLGRNALKRLSEWEMPWTKVVEEKSRIFVPKIFFLHILWIYV